MGFQFTDPKNIDLLMDMHLDLKNSMNKIKAVMDTEEVKGIFPNQMLKKLRAKYEEKLNQLGEIERELLGCCPSIKELL